MTLKGKRLHIVIAAAIALVIVLPLSASAVGPDYQGAKDPIEYAAPSPTGTAVADATAAVSGALSAVTSTSETSPAGWPGSAIGTDTALADARVFHRIGVPAAGKYTATVTFDVTNASASATVDPAGIPGFAASAAQVAALVGVVFEGDGASASDAKAFCGPGACASAQNFQLNVDINASDAGNLYIEAGLQALSYSQGMSDAAAQAAATVTDISVAPAGPAPPPTQQVEEYIEVLRETLSVDSRSLGTTSNLELEEGKLYMVQAVGVFHYTLQGDQADAECTTFGSDTIFKDRATFGTDPVTGLPNNLGSDTLDLKVGGAFVLWAPTEGTAAEGAPEVAACSTNHSYQYRGIDADSDGDLDGIPGTGDPITFRINESVEGLNDNVGVLTVQIFELVPEPATP